jgi:hypothetical protein
MDGHGSLSLLQATGDVARQEQLVRARAFREGNASALEEQASGLCESIAHLDIVGMLDTAQPKDGSGLTVEDDSLTGATVNLEVAGGSPRLCSDRNGMAFGAESFSNGAGGGHRGISLSPEREATISLSASGSEAHSAGFGGGNFLSVRESRDQLVQFGIVKGGQIGVHRVVPSFQYHQYNGQKLTKR